MSDKIAEIRVILKRLEQKVYALRDERDRLAAQLRKPAPLVRQPRISIDRPDSPNNTTSGSYTTGEWQDIILSMQTIYIYEDGLYKPIN